MGVIIQTLFFRDKVYDKPSPTPMPDDPDIRNVELTTIDGDHSTLGELMKGFTLTIVVNVASK